MEPGWQRRAWRRWKSSRMAMLAAASLLAILIAVSVYQLGRSRVDRVAVSQSERSRPADTSPLPAQPLVSITDVDAEQHASPAGRTNVSVTIGIAPRVPGMKGEVEVRIFFFDLSPANELQPTNAQVRYQWMTPVRNWSDPAPKFLVASYQDARPSGRSNEDVRFGGFLVRALVDGRIQDERSEPAEIAEAVRSEVRPVVLSRPPVLATPSPPEIAGPPGTTPPIRLAARGGLTNLPATLPTPPAEATTTIASALPYGSPAPGKPGFVYSPYDEKSLIDVRGFPPGTEVQDPNTGKRLRVP